MASNVIILFDGSCEPVNPGGFGSWGYVMWICTKGSRKKFDGYGGLGNPQWMSNNFAEFCSLGFALKKLVELGIEINQLTILGDSNLVINQVSGLWQSKSDKLRPLVEKCQEYVDTIKAQDLCFRWIPRELNVEADKLSTKSYEEWSKRKDQNGN
jgi:ribonuclease HI